jgi:putative pyoverdin transport system ATP-binding/permease protein
MTTPAMQTLGLVRFLLRSSRTVVLMTIGAGLLSGICGVAIIAIITRSVGSTTMPTTLLGAAFFTAAAGKIFTSALSQLLLSRFVQSTILNLSLGISEKLLRSPLRALEKRGSARVLATLTEDVSAVTWAVQCIPNLATNIAVLLGCTAYLAWLSWKMCLWAGAVIVLGALFYRVLHRRAVGIIRDSRAARARLFEHFRTLTAGAKELMMHAARREHFVAHELRRSADEYCQLNIKATNHYTRAEAWVQTLLYLMMGLLLFAFPFIHTTPPQTLTGYVFAILYMMGPMWTIIGTFPAVTRGHVAYNGIVELGLALDSAASPAQNLLPEDIADDVVVQLKSVEFAYDSQAPFGQSHFKLGPIDLQVRSGELLFVIGGNGSGKSTFVKLLTGLYAPVAGELIISGVPVTESRRQWHREHFSVVFADFHLFDGLMGLTAPDLEAAVQGYLRLLEIDHKVQLRDGRFTTTDLSQGQRRRLALLTAYLEDRPIYVFDEWAADQDPEYKQVFYSRLLPDLRARNKAVVVITHDDRYFHLADRVMKLEDGSLSEWGAPGADEDLAPEAAVNGG